MAPKSKLRELPQVFGRPPRNAFLISIAVDGPGTGREIGRRIGVGSRHAAELARHFVGMGVVRRLKRHKRSSLILNERFFAASELRALLLRIGGGMNSATVEKQTLASPASETIEKIFGSRDRTKTLLVVALAGQISISSIAQAAHISDRSVRDVVPRLEEEGLVRTRKDAQERLVFLEPDFCAATELRALLERIAPAFKLAGALKLHRMETERRAREAVRPINVECASLLPFGTAEQARLLVALCSLGPMKVSEAAKLLSRSQDWVRGVAESLVRNKLIQQVAVKGGRNKQRWIALDLRHPLARKLRAYIITVVGRQRPLHARDVPCDFSRSTPTHKPDDFANRLPGYDIANDVLLSVYSNRKEIEDAEIAQRLQQPRHRVRKWLLHFAEQGFIVYGELGGRMKAQRNVDFAYYERLRQLLLAATRTCRIRNSRKTQSGQ